MCSLPATSNRFINSLSHFSSVHSMSGVPLVEVFYSDHRRVPQRSSIDSINSIPFNSVCPSVPPTPTSLSWLLPQAAAFISYPTPFSLPFLHCQYNPLPLPISGLLGTILFITFFNFPLPIL